MSDATARWTLDGAFLIDPEGGVAGRLRAIIDNSRILDTLNETEVLRERVRLAEAVANEVAYPHSYWHRENLKRLVDEYRARRWGLGDE